MPISSSWEHKVLAHQGVALGSVSHHILTLAPCPTLIVQDRVKAMQQILLPLTGHGFGRSSLCAQQARLDERSF